MVDATPSSGVRVATTVVNVPAGGEALAIVEFDEPGDEVWLKINGVESAHRTASGGQETVIIQEIITIAGLVTVEAWTSTTEQSLAAGTPGPPGDPGQDGADGADGASGTAHFPIGPDDDGTATSSMAQLTVGNFHELITKIQRDGNPAHLSQVMQWITGVQAGYNLSVDVGASSQHYDENVISSSTAGTSVIQELTDAAGNSSQMVFSGPLTGSFTWQLQGSGAARPLSIRLGVGVNDRIGFFSTSLTALQQTVTGSKGGNAALDSLLSALAAYGLVIDSST